MCNENANQNLFDEYTEHIIFEFKQISRGTKHLPFWILQYFVNVNRIDFIINDLQLDIKSQDLEQCTR